MFDLEMPKEELNGVMYCKIFLTTMFTPSYQTNEMIVDTSLLKAVTTTTLE